MNEQELPEGWAESEIRYLLANSSTGKVLDQGWSPQCERFPAIDNTKWGVLKTTSIQDGFFLDNENKQLPSNLDPDPTLEVKPGDILLTCAGPRNRCGIVTFVHETRERLMLSGKMYRFRANANITSSQYITLLLRSPQMQKKIDTLKTGGSDSGLNLTQDRFTSMTVLLSPLSEQKRIVDKLDTLLGKLSECQTHLDRVPALLKRFRQSVLAAATSGKLTEDWREEKGIKTGRYTEVVVNEPFQHRVIGPDDWTQSKIGDECEFIGGSQPPKSTFTNIPSPDTIRLIQIRDYKSDKYLTFIPKELARRFCNKDDVMIGRYGPPIFQILRGLEGAYNVALMKAVPRSNSLILDYLYFFLQQINLLRYVESGSDRTAGQDGVRKELLYPYPFFLPSVPEQQEIVRRVETLLALADNIETSYIDAKAKIDRLQPALLAKAFRGELVPQNPDDEPASVLLERIKAMTETLEGKGKTTQKRTTVKRKKE